jgi:hypothetical protein
METRVDSPSPSVRDVEKDFSPNASKRIQSADTKSEQSEIGGAEVSPTAK